MREVQQHAKGVLASEWKIVEVIAVRTSEEPAAANCSAVDRPFDLGDPRLDGGCRVQRKWRTRWALIEIKDTLELGCERTVVAGRDRELRQFTAARANLLTFRASYPGLRNRDRFAFRLSKGQHLFERQRPRGRGRRRLRVRGRVRDSK